MKNCRRRDRWVCTHSRAGTPFCRETRNRVKTFFEKFGEFLSGAMASVIRPEVKWHNLLRNLWCYRRKLKFTALNLLPAEEFLFKFRPLTQSEAICRNSQAACLVPHSRSGGQARRDQNCIAHPMQKFLVSRGDCSQCAAQFHAIVFDEVIRTKTDPAFHCF